MDSGLRLDKATALAVGFGLHNAWVCSAMYSTHAVFNISSLSLPGVRGGNFSILYLISIAAFCLVMFTVACFDKKLTVFSRSRKVMVIAAGATCVGTFLALAAPSNLTIAFVLECCSGIITGFGSAVLLLYWGIAFAREKTRTIAIAGSIAVVLGFVLNTLFLQTIPSPFGGIVAAVIPLLELLILAAITPKREEGSGLSFNALPTSKSRLGMSLVAPVALIGFALGVLKQASVQTTLEGMLTPETLVILLLAGSLTISLFTFYAYLQNKSTWDHFLRILIPAITCISLLASLFISENAAFSDLFLLVGYIFIEALLWVYFCYLAHKFHLSPIFLLSLSRGILTLFMLAGALVVFYTNPWFEQIPFSDESFVIIPLILIALGYALMPRESDLEQRIVQCPVVRLVALELDENLGFLESHQHTVGPDKNQTHEDKKTATQEVADNVSEKEFAARKEEEPVLNTYASEAQKAMLAAKEEDNAIGTGRFSRKVKKVAKIYLLTERETDVLFELAKGNSATYIQEKYYISAGTVKTHIRNIYRKLDVHKRNDLLRLIEQTEDYD